MYFYGEKDIRYIFFAIEGMHVASHTRCLSGVGCNMHMAYLITHVLSWTKAYANSYHRFGSWPTYTTLVGQIGVGFISSSPSVI